MSFSDKLIAVMKEKGLRQQDIIERSGIPSGQISSYVNGKTSPSWETVIKIADALDVSLDYLAGRDMTKVRYSDEYQQRINDALEKMNEQGRERTAGLVDDLAFKYTKRDLQEGESQEIA